MDTKEFIDRCRKIRNGSPNAFYALVDAYCAQIDNALELDRQKRDGVGVFDPRFMAEDNACRNYRRATAEERAMARGFVTLWESVGVQDAEDWLYALRNRAELLASLDEDDDCREAQDNTPSLGPFKTLQAEAAK